jgi:hypothetical protein
MTEISNSVGDTSEHTEIKPGMPEDVKAVPAAAEGIAYQSQDPISTDSLRSLGARMLLRKSLQALCAHAG